MKIYKDILQLSPEWVAIRLGKVTGSHFSDVMNKKSGRKTYMFRLLGERFSGESYEAYSNKTMDRGSELEPEARIEYARMFGDVKQVGFVEYNDNVGCSPDGLVGNSGIIEIKCPLPAAHLRTIYNKKMPAVYTNQVQGNLWVTGREWCDFISYNPKVKARPFWKTRVYRDEEKIKELAIQTTMFVTELLELEERIVNKNLDF